MDDVLLGHVPFQFILNRLPIFRDRGQNGRRGRCHTKFPADRSLVFSKNRAEAKGLAVPSGFSERQTERRPIVTLSVLA